MRQNRILGLIMAVCFLLQMLPIIAFATSEIPHLTFEDAAIAETVAGEGYAIDGTALTITSAGTYRIDGSCANGSIEVAKSLTDVTLILDGLMLESSATAPIILKKTSNVILHIENTVTLTNSEDPANETSEDTTVAEAFEGAAIKAKSGSAVTFCGSGKLVINGNAKNGIKGAATSTLTFADSRTSYDIKAINNGIGADGGVVIHGGDFKIEAENDGIKSVPEETDADSVGSVEINGGTFDLTVNGDGIQADSLLKIAGGDFDIQTFGGYNVDGTKYYNVSNGLDKDTAGTFDGDTMSCKAIKASGDRTDVTNELLITGGTFAINSADDAVHSDAYATVTGGTFHIYTGDDGMHADTSLTLGEENGLDRDPDVYVYTCFEGLEAGTVYLYNGRHWLNALDDGINAGGGSDSTTEGTTNDSFNPGGRPGRPGSSPGSESSTSSDYALYVYGGDVYVNCDGDGLDSNGTLMLSGGNLDVLSQASGGDNSPFDSDGTMTLNGATVFAAGTNAMNENFSSGSQTSYTSKTSVNANAVINVTAGSEILHSITLTKKVNYMLYSAPSVTSTPTFVTNGTLKSCASTSWAHEWNDGGAADGKAVFTCTDCGATEQQTAVTADAAQCDDTHAYAAEETEPDEGFAITFATDSGVAGIDVYYTQDYTAASETNATAAVSRNSDTGEPDSSGSGQLNFLIRLEEGYTLSSVSVTDGTYKNIKDSADTGVANLYRITKITADTVVTVTTVQCTHANLANLAWSWTDDYGEATLGGSCTDCGNAVSFTGNITGTLGEDRQITFTATCTVNETVYTDTQMATAYTVTFDSDAGVESILVYYTKDYTAVDETAVESAVARDGDSGDPVITGDGQVNFRIVLKEGYALSSVTADANYKNVKDVSDDTNPNTYRITKITGDVVVTVVTEATYSADVNGDGATDSADVAALLGYLNGNRTINTEIADINGDGKISLADVLRLMKEISA